MIKHLSVPILTALFIIMSTHAEPAWRAINTGEGAALPDYKNEPNPFPIRTPPVAEVQVDTEALKKEQTRTELIHTLRELLRSDKVYNINLERLQIRGLMSGQEGMRALIGEQWRQEGDKILVPIEGTSHILNTLAQLATFDSETAQKLSVEVKKRMPEGEDIHIQIVKITPSVVYVKDEKNKKYQLKVQ